MAKCIEGQPSLTGASAREYCNTSEVSGYFPGQLLGSAAVSSKKWDAPLAMWVQDENSRILVLAFEIGCDQACDSTDRSHEDQNIPCLPMSAKGCFDESPVGRCIHMAAFEESLQQGLACGGQSNGQTGAW